jgi:hypothetical protein
LRTFSAARFCQALFLLGQAGLRLGAVRLRHLQRRLRHGDIALRLDRLVLHLPPRGRVDA